MPLGLTIQKMSNLPASLCMPESLLFINRLINAVMQINASGGAYRYTRTGSGRARDGYVKGELIFFLGIQASGTLV